MKLPNYRDEPAWRYVYIAVIWLVFAVLGLLLFGAGWVSWLWFGVVVAFAIRAVVEFRRS